MKTMRKILLVIPLAITLGGCPSLDQIGSVMKFSTASVSNPVTKDMLFDAENGAIIAVAGLKAYKKSCVELSIPQSCRATIGRIQVYTRKLAQFLPQLRAFVKNNDQVNAVIAYNAVMGLIKDFETEATAAGIKLGVN